jgi:hypothetical protein
MKAYPFFRVQKNPASSPAIPQPPLRPSSAVPHPAMSDHEKKDAQREEIEHHAPPIDEITAMNQRLANPLAVRPFDPHFFVLHLTVIYFRVNMNYAPRIFSQLADCCTQASPMPNSNLMPNNLRSNSVSSSTSKSSRRVPLSHKILKVHSMPSYIHVVLMSYGSVRQARPTG